jgi:hypothetical protein
MFWRDRDLLHFPDKLALQSKDCLSSANGERPETL